MSTEIDSAAGEREFKPRTTGTLFPWVKRASLIELAIFCGLLVVWAIPGLDYETFLFGTAHGIGFVALCILIWIAVLRREAPFWLLASALTPVGPVGSSLGVVWIERKESSERAAAEADGAAGEAPPDEAKTAPGEAPATPEPAAETPAHG